MHCDTVAQGFLPDDGWAHADKTHHQGSSRIRLLRCCVRSGGNLRQYVNQRPQPAESFPQTDYWTHSRGSQYPTRKTTAPATGNRSSCHAGTRPSDTPRRIGAQRATAVCTQDRRGQARSHTWYAPTYGSWIASVYKIRPLNGFHNATLYHRYCFILHLHITETYIQENASHALPGDQTRHDFQE